jgi:hypothetical protein
MSVLSPPNPVQSIPTPEEVRGRIAVLSRECRLLRKLLRLAEQKRLTLPDNARPRQEMPPATY